MLVRMVCVYRAALSVIVHVGSIDTCRCVSVIDGVVSAVLECDVYSRASVRV